MEKSLRKKKRKENEGGCMIKGDQKDYFGKVRLSFWIENESALKKVIKEFFFRRSGCYLGWNQSVFWKRLGCCSVWNQSVFWKRFKLLFGVKSVHILEKVQAAVQGEIKLYFGRDSGCCLGWNQSMFWKRFRLLFGVKSVCVLEEI